jgi:hypothetical protein
MNRANSSNIRIRPQERLLENLAVSGTFDLDYNLYETFNLVLTGATTFTESNLPTSGEDTKIIVLTVTGDFSLTYPAGWSDYITGVYDGTVQNLIVVQYFKSALYKVQITKPD